MPGCSRSFYIKWVLLLLHLIHLHIAPACMALSLLFPHVSAPDIGKQPMSFQEVLRCIVQRLLVDRQDDQDLQKDQGYSGYLIEEAAFQKAGDEGPAAAAILQDRHLLLLLLLQ
uniref:Uncharacterized protein n=1 Tax=Sarcocystis aucheniae TaxID=65407 RepID=A0A5P9S3K0_9APIC|nr:hypothetical protein [Sarcocystis aucheniae]